VSSAAAFVSAPNELAYEAPGFCPICDKPTVYRAKFAWYRGHLRCAQCDSVPRERALAVILEEKRPDWRNCAIHESSPARRGISLKLMTECPGYIGSHYFPDQPPGTTVRNYRNENLEKQTFADASFDLVMSLDVMEHVFAPWQVYQEVYRTLRPEGYYLHTFPIGKDRATSHKARAELASDGTIRHIEKPEFHGNPIDPQNGSLVTFDYGYEVHQAIAEWVPGFDVRIIRFCDKTAGIMGEFTDVVVCQKRR
jgi:SAM-dependent methyltransferase